MKQPKPRQCIFKLCGTTLRSIIVTERMILRSFETLNSELMRSDIQRAKTLYSDAEVMRWVDRHQPYDRQAVNNLVSDWISSWRNRNPSSSWMAFQRTDRLCQPDFYLKHPEKLTSDFLGIFMLDPGFENGSVELGYVLPRRHWGKGLGMEGARALSGPVINEINRVSNQFGFDFRFRSSRRRSPYIAKIVATVSISNRASISILDRIGFTPYPKRIKDRERLKELQIRLESLSKDETGRLRRKGSRKGMNKYFFILPTA